MELWMNGQINGLIALRQMERWNGWMDGQYIDGWMNGLIANRQMEQMDGKKQMDEIRLIIKELLLLKVYSLYQLGQF